jgi:hypothetical protein
MRRQYKRQVRARKQARQSKELFIGGAALGLAALLLLAAFFVWNNNRGAATAFAYGENEVTREGPFTAVHAMEPGPAIPFLPGDSPQPKITISETSYNFGSIGPLDVMRRTFAIRNDGDAPLTISNAYTTCGCTIAEFSASVIPPGMVAEVTVIFDAGAHDSRGQTVRRGVIIENNDPRRSQAEIWIQASVRAY